LTDPGAAVTVIALFIVALRLTVATLEFRWALPLRGISPRTATANARGSPLHPASLFFCPSLCREVKFLFLESRETRPVFSKPLGTPVPRVRPGRRAIFASPGVLLRVPTTNWTDKTQSGATRPAGLDSVLLDVGVPLGVLAGEPNRSYRSPARHCRHGLNRMYPRRSLASGP
jgi:hypothetical protein